MWLLSPSGWPFFAAGSDEQALMRASGYVVIDESEVPAAVAAYNAGSPPPAVPEFLTEQDAADAIGGSGPLGVAARAALVPAVRSSVAAATSTAPYDPARNVYNLKPSHLRRTRAMMGKARAGTGVWTFAVVGDSTTFGVGASPGVTDWPHQLEAMLNTAGVASTGTGIEQAVRTGENPHWTVTGTWGDSSASSILAFTNTAGATATYTSPKAGTIFRLWYRGTSGAFTVAIDGGSAVAVTPPGTDTMQVYEVTGLANTTHTAVVTCTTPNMYLLAAEVTSGGNGLRMFHAAKGGWTSANVAASSAWYVGTMVPASTTNGFNSDTITLMIEVNDVNTSVPVATFKSNMQSAITNLKRNAADVILLTAVPSGGMDFTVGYTQSLYELADSNDLPLIDLQDRYGSFGSTNGFGLMSDSFHPKPGLYADIARAVFRVIDG